MSDPERATIPGDELRCDCGFQSHGETLEACVRNAQRHARTVHRIDVTVDQVLANGDRRRP